jgi:hypothetical protein
MRFTTFLALALMVLAVCADFAQAAFPSARWRRPVGFGPHGDLRPLMKKLHKQNPPSQPRNTPDPMEAKTSKSRSYHFQYGPLFPEHHSHIEQFPAFWPADHKLYY